jgi:5-methylcytosine-specific restriction enzyme subunit McrC
MSGHVRQLGHMFVATVVEYGDSVAIIDELAVATGEPAARVREQLVATGERLQAILRLSENPIEVVGDFVRVRNVAGLVRIGPQVHLEVAPKFLGATEQTWREDFFLAANLSKYGRLLPSEKLSVEAGPRANLASLVGRTIIRLYADNSRRPLRTYRRQRVREFALEGEVDAESLWFPDDDGYEQDIIVFNSKNKFNEVIFSAIGSLLSDVADPGVRGQLSRIREGLAPQRNVQQAQHVRLPGRAAHWQTLFDLCVDVLNGFSLHYDAGAFYAPGYVFDSWRVWQDLVTLALNLGANGASVLAQAHFPLGQRTRRGKNTDVHFIPDVVVKWNGGATAVVDAKYKGRADEHQSIVESDLYESLAFAKAANARDVVLVYPDTRANHKLGNVDLFETVVVGNVAVHGITIGTTGLSRVGGLETFAQCLNAATIKLVKGPIN